MRSIPGMTVICPSDAVETEKAVQAVMDFNGPAYVRLGRADIPVFNDAKMQFQIGKGIVLREGKDVSIVATGLCVYECLQAAEILAQNGVQAEVINMHTIKPLDKELLLSSAKSSERSFVP